MDIEQQFEMALREQIRNTTKRYSVSTVYSLDRGKQVTTKIAIEGWKGNISELIVGMIPNPVSEIENIMDDIYIRIIKELPYDSYGEIIIDMYIGYYGDEVHERAVYPKA